ncbi:unnamed protein product [Caenorhabditis auriculariae]|uniref:thiosulfate sulfurtransferase n=1 Tax=Caenorhabditis auriculariae TaxID=2777116 RepID=A0A8S1GSK1_9PELO|nr:unnamed protein product [Caenorhabditis auriculariae]
MSLKKIIDVKTVRNLLRKGVFNKEGVRLLDCSFAVAPRSDWQEFKKKHYGKFEKALSTPSNSRLLYLSGHIPEAVHFDFDYAMYPSKYERFTHYPPEIFEKYAQLIGLNSGEHLVFYGRGPLGGMLFASKAAWLFKSYGHDKVSLVDGGFDTWRQHKFEVSTEDLQLPSGNFPAKDSFRDHLVDFDHLTQKDENGKQYIEKTSEVNFLDSRSRGQFNGTEDTGLDPWKVNGSRIAGFKNAPAAELFNQNKTLKNEDELFSWLKSNGMVDGQEVVTSCNAGVQAALLAYVIDSLNPNSKPKLYNGSLKEMEQRDPKKISEGPQHLPSK